jgi:uncharacterized membrane protein
VAGFALGFTSTALIIAGLVLGAVGLFGAVLVRAQPETANNINYDPSSVTLVAPIPVIAGFLVAWFALRIKRRWRSIR